LEDRAERKFTVWRGPEDLLRLLRIKGWHVNADKKKNLKKWMRWLSAFESLFGLTT
jgi:hypothetical protein